MKNVLLLSILSVFIFLSGCKKEAALSASTSPLVGIYNVPVNNGSGLTQIQVVQASDKSLKVVLKITQAYYQYTAATLQDVALTGTNVASINETQNIIEATDLGPYKFTGTIQFSGNTASLTGTAISVRIPYNAENSPMNFTFSGSKVN